MASFMLVNNETGAIYDIAAAAKAVRENSPGAFIHTDAVQAAGHMHLNVRELGVDLMSVSGHKFHGPKGIGALYVRTGVRFDKFMNGGHQERNKRAGTENVAGIVGMGKAIELAYSNIDKNLANKIRR